MKLLKHDPQEDDPKIGPLIQTALKEAGEIVEREFDERGWNASGETMGKSPGIWKRAAEILHERHGIEWKDPMRMNPGLFVD